MTIRIETSIGFHPERECALIQKFMQEHDLKEWKMDVSTYAIHFTKTETYYRYPDEETI